MVVKTDAKGRVSFGYQLGNARGVEKIKAIKSLRLRGRMQQGGFTAQVGQDSKAPDLLRQTFTVQGISKIRDREQREHWVA